MSRSAGNRLVRLGDVAATLLFVAQFTHPPCSRELHHRVSYRVSATDYSPPITPGAALRRLAIMQEGFYLVHGHYAPRASDLTDPALPPRWRAVVVVASAGQYRMRLVAPGEGGSGFVCHLWGRRLRPETIEPFEIDCRPMHESSAFAAVVAASR